MHLTFTISRPFSQVHLTRGLVPRATLAALAATVLAAYSAHGSQVINVPNGLFTLPSAQGINPPFNTDGVIPTDWTGTTLAGEEPGSIGVFVNSSSPGPLITNDSGPQAAYIYAFPTNGIFQDIGSQFTLGTPYTLTVGVLGGSGLAAGETLQVSLYYGNPSNVLGSTTATYETNVPVGETFLTPFNVSIPAVPTGAPEIGQDIGVEIQATSGSGEAYWDVGNVTLVPEPATAGLLAFGLGALVLRRRSFRTLSAAWQRR